MLELRVLGDMTVRRDGAAVALPPSKKTRALLAYLAIGGRPHRRDQLCTLLWDIADDPRGALRWSLSKLRPIVDEPDAPRIVADRDTVAFEAGDAYVDLPALRRRLGAGLETIPVEELERLAAEFRGEFLEGLELPDLHDFHVWAVAEREQARVLHARLLTALVERLAGEPERALPFARTLVHVDPLNEPARANLVRLLGAGGHRREAKDQYDAAARLFAELGAALTGELDAAWDAAAEQPARAVATSSLPPAAPPPTAAPPDTQPAARGQLVGRAEEWTRLLGTLDETQRARRERVVLLTGEPGVGKTRLLDELMATARERGATVLAGASYEAESGRPYGPWVDALHALHPSAVGDTIGGELALLLPGLSARAPGEQTRDRLFGAVVELIAARAHSAPPVVLVFDDVQWSDEASAALLHYVTRMNRHRPVLVALSAREGELLDNDAVAGALRSLRRDHLLDELAVGPLSDAETAELVRTVAPDADAAQVFAQSAGNPLFALEVARARPRDEAAPPPTLMQLVRDRVDRLPPAAADVLRWGAVLGQSFHVRRLAELTSCGPDELMDALELLERHALLREARDAGGGGYAFAHDLVRHVVYSELSEPRRRLMHWRIAEAMRERAAADETVAADLAFHAARAGETGLAARACVAAGRRCLRLFANADAYALARRGLRYAEELPEVDRVPVTLELLEIGLAARKPEDADAVAGTIETLAERALDLGSLEHARLGFHMLSYLRWEGGDWSDAQRQMMRAEHVSRAGDEDQRIVAMAEAARCLCLLERDLSQAEALLLEAGLLSARRGVESVAIPAAVGMLRLHQGHYDEAAELLRDARTLAQRQQDRLGEFQALEHLVMLEWQRADYPAACTLCDELVTLGEKLREGSDAPFAHALAALCGLAQGHAEVVPDLEGALEGLRLADAKHRLAFALTRAAELDLRAGKADRARTRAEEALRMARALERPTEIALAHVAIARAAAAAGDETAVRQHVGTLRDSRLRGVSAYAERAVEALLAEVGGAPASSAARD